MSNQLKVGQVDSIVALWRRGWSLRRIARELGVHRDTVSRHIRAHQEESKPAKVTAGNDRSVSRCEPWREVIGQKLDLGLSAQRIWQDLCQEEGFEAAYESVKRFVRRLRESSDLPVRRMECEPGREAQVDFGTGAPLEGADGRRRRTHVLRIVLSHSRKGYSEAVLSQTTDSFIRCLENAFWAFGGAPQTVVIDNLRAAVSKADWYEPELNPKLLSLCRHYGTTILPARPRTPRHKGKVERGIGYVKGNALKGRSFPGLAAQNEHLRLWEAQVADCRIHGTTRKQVGRLFEQVERPALLPLPPGRFPCFQEGQRMVHRDGHVEVEKAYYSVPPEFVGRKVWVRWDTHMVRVFNLHMEQLAAHARREPGGRSTSRNHLASEKISVLERGAGWMLGRARRIGPQTGRWAAQVLEQRGVAGLRVLQGLLAMARKHRAEQIEKACELALTHGLLRLRSLRELLGNPQRQQQLPLMQEHALIRPLEHYGRIVPLTLRPDGNDGNGEFIASEGTSALPSQKGPARTDGQAPCTVRPPAAALGSLSSGALSSAPAPQTLRPAGPQVNENEGRP